MELPKMILELLW